MNTSRFGALLAAAALLPAFAVATPAVAAEAPAPVVQAAAPGTAPGQWKDYVGITVKPRGNSAGGVSVNLNPAGLQPAANVVIRTKWYGFTIATRKVTYSHAHALPSIIPWISGYRAEVTVNLAGGGSTSGSVGLFRNG